MIADLNKRDSTGSATVRLAIMDGIHYLGFYVGNAIAGPVKDNFGLKYNFALGLLFAIIAGAYTLLFIKETLVKQKDENELEKVNLELWSDANTKGNKLRLISFSTFVKLTQKVLPIIYITHAKNIFRGKATVNMLLLYSVTNREHHLKHFRHSGFHWNHLSKPLIPWRRDANFFLV